MPGHSSDEWIQIADEDDRKAEMAIFFHNTQVE
jgi:hypothetical protein